MRERNTQVKDEQGTGEYSPQFARADLTKQRAWQFHVAALMEVDLGAGVILNIHPAVAFDLNTLAARQKGPEVAHA